MTTISMVGAASGCEMDWHGINWAEAHQTTRRLQARIAKAVDKVNSRPLSKGA